MVRLERDSVVGQVRIQLVGGVGNQLFTYFAGAAIAGSHQMKLEIDISRSHPLITGHTSSIMDFDLPGKWIIPSPHDAPRLSPKQQLSLKVRHQLSKLGFLHRFRRIEDYSETIGWVPEILLHPPTKTLRGYFQSWRYVHIAREFGFPTHPKLKVTSPKLNELMREADLIEPISVHIRRGDYLQVPEFGVLGRPYYMEGIELLRSRGHTGPVWIFTDSPELANEVIEGRVITTLNKPTEELVLMSKCKAHIIANSTFSWWGAWLNENSPDVVAPMPWFKDGPEVRDLLPSSWMTVPHR